MSHTLATNSSTYTYNTPTLPYSTQNHASIAYKVFVFSISVILISLGLRIVLALFVLNNPFTRGLTILSDPLVMPFTRVFHDIHGMVQPATALAFSAYFFVYWIVALAHRLFRRNPRFVSPSY